MNSQIFFVEKSIAESIEMQKNKILHKKIDDENVNNLFKYIELNAMNETFI